MASVSTLQLRIATVGNDLDLKTMTCSINESITEYNEASKKAINPKELKLLKVEAKYIEVQITSDQKLQAVGKACRLFSQKMLAKEPDLKTVITSSGQLFRIKEVGLPVTEFDDPSIQQRVLDISDEDMICDLVRYLRAPKGSGSAYEKKRSAIDKCKQILLESGIIKENSDKDS